MIRFDEVRDEEKWNDLLLKSNGSFTQSWQWGNVLERQGDEIFRFSIVRDDNVVGCFAFYIRQTPAGRYGYIPRGPAVGDRNFSQSDWSEFIESFNNFAKNRGLVFLLWEPAVEGDYWNLKVVENRQPRHTILIDLSLPLEEILQKFNETRGTA